MTLNEYFSRYYALICDGNLDDLESYFCFESPLLNATKQQFETLRKQFDFKFTLKKVSLIAKQDDLLVVRDMVHFKAEIDGKDIDKVSMNLHSLVKESGEWKLHCSTPLPEAAV